VYPTNLFRLGLVKKLELRIVNELVTYRYESQTEARTIQTISGMEDLQIGFKYQITSDTASVVVGVIAHGIVPTGSVGLTANDYGLLSRFTLSYDLDDKRNLSTNLGYNNFNLDLRDAGLLKRSDGNFTYTFVYGQSLSDRLGVYLEAFGDWVELQDWEHNLDAGLTYLLNDRLQLDYSFGWGLTTPMNYHSIGISFRLPR
jgi:hypothetical protein